MLTPQDITLINKYLDDSLEPDEIILFKNRFDQNKAFAIEVKQYTDITIALKSASKTKIQNHKADLLNQTKTPHHKETAAFIHPNLTTNAPSKGIASIRKIEKRNFYIALAASFALLIGIGSYYIFRKNPASEYEQMFAQSYKNPLLNTMDFTTRAEASDTDPKLIREFELAISYIELRKFTDAKNVLEKLNDLPQNEISDDIQWYLSLCYVKLGKKETAINNLIQILNSDSFYSNDARILYQALTE